MLVRQILDSKPASDVVVIQSGASVRDAVKMLSERRIGAIVITGDETRPLGILSERDIVREMGRKGEACLNDVVDEMMTRELVSTTAQETADQVLAKMTEGRFRHIPVMDDDTMIGLISIGDVVKARLSELTMEKDALEGMIKGF